jgi:Domain of unknown function (DUF4352)
MRESMARVARGCLTGVGAIAVLGVLGVVVLVVLVLALSGGEQEEQVIYQPGDEVEAGNFTWTITEARRANTLTSVSGFGDPKQGNFVVVDFQLTNTSNSAQTVTSNSINLKDTDGNESEPDTEVFEYIERDKRLLLEQINPGVTQEGEVIFSVAPEASGFQLELGTGAQAQRGLVDLGF